MPKLDESGMSRRYRLLRDWVLLFAGIIFGFTVHGTERVPKSGPVVVAANHWRFFDPVFVCMAVPRRVQWMAKKELFLKPLEKPFAMLGAFPVDRQGGGRGALRVALSHLKDGWALGIFPEGTRKKPGEREYREFEGDGSGTKNGAVMLAARSGAAIVPVFVGPVPSLSERFRGKKMEAYIGEPIYLDDSTKGRTAYEEASKEMMHSIYAFQKNEGNPV